MRLLPARSLLLGVVATTVLALAPAANATPTPAAPAPAATVTAHHVEVRAEVHHDTSPPLRSMHAQATTTRPHPVRHVVPDGTHAPTTGRVQSSPDTSGQTATPRVPSTNADFAALGNLDGVLPPDTQGAAGANQYVSMVNSHLAVFSKTGATLLAPETTSTLWAGFGGGCQTNNDGDGVVLYDALSGHWLLSQFSVTTLPYLQCVAVSQTSDATGAYNRYAFQTPAQDAAGNGFADYPKLGVWPDAYYATFNLFNQAGTAGQGSQVCAYDRAKMIAGQAATQQCTQVIGPNAAPLDDDTVLPSSVEGSTAPPAGSPEYLAAIPQSTSAQSTLLTWTYHVDFVTPANTQLSAQTTLSVSPYTEPCFNVRDCVPQTGTQKVDAVADRLMSRLSYRNLGTRESLVVDHSVVSGSSIGMRWYELAPSGGALSLVQQGTVAPDANYRWMGSISEDKSGDIAMGYSVSSSALNPQIRYTGRLVGDPAGTMPQGEATVALSSSGAQTIGNRWGDYTSMTVDPADDCTFWYTNEHGTTTGDWATQVASFKFPSCGGVATNDFSISASPASGSVTAGQSASSTISTAVTSGSAQTVSLSASGLPTGASASFSPASVTAGASSSLTISTATSTPAGTYAVTVTGTGTSVTHSTTYSLTVSPVSSGGITNGGFETGTLAGWTSTGTTSVVNVGAHTGTYAAQAGSTSPTNGDSSIAQTFTVPTGSTGLSFWYNVTCPDTITYDWATATLRDNTTSTTSTPLAKTCVSSSGWQQVTSAVTAGHSYTLTLTSHDDNYATDPTYTKFDDVALTGSVVTNDFSISASPTSGSVTAGQSATSTISTAVTAGSAQTVSLSASGLPSGASASFSPASVTAGSSSTLTISTATSTPAGTYSVTVTGTGTSATHSTTYSLTVSPVSSGGITNGGFETGTLAGWTSTGTTSVVNVGAHTGTYAAQAGSTSPTNGDSSIAQTFTVPSGSTGLSFWYNVTCPDTITYDWATATLRDNTTSTTSTPLAKTCVSSSGWQQVTSAVTAGHSYTLTLTSHDDNYATDPTYTKFDDVALTGAVGGLTQISADPYSGDSAQHATEAEPDSYSVGNTVVTATQVGRYSNGGADDIGWGTSTDGGTTWQHGFLPGITTVAGGTWARVSDPSVIWDARHGTWLISGLVIDAATNGRGVSISRSTDGLTWSNPVIAAGNNAKSYDKEWVTCDNTATSPHYGNCYVEVDVTSSSNQIVMVTSTDGGLTWSNEVSPAGTPSGLGGQPLVQPNGTVVVPYSQNQSGIAAFTSTNGGASWNAPVSVSTSNDTTPTGMRAEPLPSAEIDAAGTIYVVWDDCRFRAGCTADDLVLSTSTNGTTWSAVTRVPIDAVTSPATYFTPGIGVDRTTSGATTKIGLTYYFYPNASCTTATCQLEVGYVSSTNGGATWSAPRTLAGPMTLSWLAQAGGAMVGDYIGTTVVGGRAVSTFAVGHAPSGSTLNQALDTAGPLAITGGALRASSTGAYSMPRRPARSVLRLQ